MEVDGAEVLDALLEGFVFVFEGDGAAILALDFGGGATAEFFDVRAHFGCDVIASVVNISLRNQVKVLPWIAAKGQRQWLDKNHRWGR